MIIEKKLDILILDKILTDYYKDNDYKDFINRHYDVNAIQNRYIELGREYLNDYALNTTEKSD